VKKAQFGHLDNVEDILVPDTRCQKAYNISLVLPPKNHTPLSPLSLKSFQKKKFG
jgi:glycyl-tRNA synthetase (class II)